ncbi:LRR receptor-like serine/threonine-protein kinase [Dorcoceras hygrometricum]|uniref:LRR receptor-like serine/threonine-protein kinase n=1 Tax=Dorcoceras hygrometricum TaxID=472368 RepID=A0A2Z7DCL2_9LAMI|nr:LRR receptor-like serine/threonine-protein kinase [Dorcoceras hygrometricum]
MAMGIDQLNLHSIQLGYLKILQEGNTDPNNTKQENKYKVKPQYEELSKQLIMRHAISRCYECMRAIKDRIDRPVYQLEIISIEPLYHAQQVSQWKSSVHDLHDPSAHHSSVVFRHDKSVGHHSDDSVGLFRHEKSVGQSQRGSQLRRTHETELSKKLRTPVASRFHSNANSGLQMSSNRKSKSLGFQRHQNRSNHRRITAAISGNSRNNQSLHFSSHTQNNTAPTNHNDVVALHQLVPNSLRKTQQLVTLNNPDASLIPDATKTQRFNLSKRRRVAPTTVFSNQQLVTQSQHILPTQLLIKFHQLQATVPLTRVDIWNALHQIPCISATAGFHETTAFYSRAINC